MKCACLCAISPHTSFHLRTFREFLLCEKLSRPRGHEVFEYLVIGRLNKQIAFDLGISARTVEIHRARVMKKMEARNLAHLVWMALALGIDPELS